MANSDGGESQGPGQNREPFVGSADRPEVRLDPDMPVSELTVRDLGALLGGGIRPGPKPHIADIKLIKYEKYIKLEKWEKIEKFEFPKHEKWEYIEVPVEFEIPIPDPRGLESLIEAISQLQKEVAELKRQRGGG